MMKIKSVVLIDDNDIDNFVNSKILEHYGATDIRIFKKAQEAIIFFNEAAINYQLIIVGNNMPLMNGFDFIDEFRKLNSQKTTSKIVLLSAFLNPEEIELANNRKIKFMLKPLVIKELLLNISS